MYHPWRELRNLTDVELIWTDLTGQNPGYTDGINKIWMHNKLEQVERRCIITHEIVHYRHGHTTCQRTAAETTVRLLTARLLIPLDKLIEHRRWARSIDELADELWVIPMVLQDRIRHLTRAEQNAIRADQMEHSC